MVYCQALCNKLIIKKNQKRLENTNIEENIIYGLEQIARIECDSLV